MGNKVVGRLLSVINEKYKFDDDTMNNIYFENKRIVFIIAHRRGNSGELMRDILLMYKNALARELKEI